MSTLQQILANIFTLLGWTNLSTTSIWYKMAQAMAIPVDNTITELSNNLATINTTIANKNYGRSGWYIATSKAFQYGYSLSQNDTNGNIVVNGVTIGPGAFYYPVVDVSAQIITQAAFETSVAGSIIKAATVTGGVLGPLSSDQLAAFISYWNVYALAGLPPSIVSLPANTLNFNAIATFYSTASLTAVQNAVSAALTSFQDNFAFDGVFYITDLESYITSNVNTQLGTTAMRSFFTSAQTIDGVGVVSGTATLSAGYFVYANGILSSIIYNPI